MGHERIETPRLVLRPPRLEDAAAIYSRYASDPAVTRYLAWPTHGSLEDTRAFLEFSRAEWERWPAGPYLVLSRAEGRLLGGTGYVFSSMDRAVTGYAFARDAWGQGFATEALSAIVELAPALGLRDLSALCHGDHRASARVLEKCGFVWTETRSAAGEFPNLGTDEPCPVRRYVRTFSSVAG